jgi:cell division protein FtsI (penicillin-binding protein 3)
MMPFRDGRSGQSAVWLLGCLFLPLGMAAWRVLEVNASHDVRLDSLISTQQHTKRILPARRGAILDRHGKQLATSVDAPSVFVDPGLVDDIPETARMLGRSLGLDPGWVEERIRHPASPRFSWIDRKVDAIAADVIEQLNLAGVGVRLESARRYPMGSLAAHLLGFTNIDGSGVEGLELVWNKHLTGADGQVGGLCDVRRRLIRQQVNGFVPPADGGDVMLTIDSIIQSFAEDALVDQVKDFSAEAGSVVVLDPKSGDLLAMASWPAFDPNDPMSSPVDDRRFRAVTDAIEPGSVFKPFVAAGFMEHNVVTPWEEIDCEDGVHYFGRRRIKDTKSNGIQTIDGIIANSSNIGMGKLAERLGESRMYETVSGFGFGTLTEVGLPGESPGVLRPLESWTSYSTYSIPIGQELTVTALQLACGLGAIVNEGVLLKPRVVRGLYGADGSAVWEAPLREEVRRVMRRDVAMYLTRKSLRGVVCDGGGLRASLDDWRVLGKTGTAQVAWDRNRAKALGLQNVSGYEPRAYTGSFIGAAPAEDPQLVVVMMIHRPDADRGYYGGLVAAPGVRRILGRTLSYWGVPTSPEEWYVPGAW